MAADGAHSVAEAVQRLGRRDKSLKRISLWRRQLADADVGELADCLLARPDAVTSVSLGISRLTDETGVKLARYLAASATVESLNLAHNQVGEATYTAVAAALGANPSLRTLYLFGNRAVDQSRVDAAFIEALRVNADRPAQSLWLLYSFGTDDLPRLRAAAERLGHPSLRALLALRYCGSESRPVAPSLLERVVAVFFR